VQTVQELFQQLSKFYWSPKHPSEYVLDTPAGRHGIGAIAHLDYAAFNLTWAAKRGVITTSADHVEACKYFRMAHVFVNQVQIKGEPLETWITLLNQEQFIRLVDENLGDLDPQTTYVLESCR